ncbi:MAG TPA: P27 family phage terminase small subunit [Galbitalea sp.]
MTETTASRTPAASKRATQQTAEPRPPRVLGRRGAALWRKLVAKYEFDPQEIELLLETCRTLDRIDDLEKSVSENGVMIEGSQGQKVLNGAVAEMRQQQTGFARLVAQLNLFDAELGQALSARSVASKTAGQARWRERTAAKRA